MERTGLFGRKAKGGLRLNKWLVISVSEKLIIYIITGFKIFSMVMQKGSFGMILLWISDWLGIIHVLHKPIFGNFRPPEKKILRFILHSCFGHLNKRDLKRVFNDHVQSKPYIKSINSLMNRIKPKEAYNSLY